MTKGNYKKQIIEQMISLKIYKHEFDLLIDTMAEICSLRDKNKSEWKKTNNMKQCEEYTNKAGATNLCKSPYYLNNLQYNEQILKYGKALGLTPGDAMKLGVSLEEETDDLSDYL